MPFYLYLNKNINWYLSNMIGYGFLVLIISSFLFLKYNYKNIKLVFILPAIFFLTTIFYSIEIKNDDTKKEEAYLHPSLSRSIKLAEVVGFDPVVTDISRSTAFYQRNKLKRVRHSQHYVKNNKSYAVDIRTNNSNFIRNRLLQFYFMLLGFDTMIHGGTAVHLHVGIPLTNS